ncbi:hypothetical protein HNR46_000451 [Haloferula luteola]|uniref:F5/8 type C domain-containing protein n=1 Tax=Haloferula luteola TaxID=595692 RepID=A0A840UVK6_9BACT|nr:discoidin domain-containing protein [Haloferula luteola]MBB5350227.1 hypothetical protein [Haloferula luteola]
MLPSTCPNVSRALLLGLATFLNCLPTSAATAPDLHQAGPPVHRPDRGLDWPDGQALPTFAQPAEDLDALMVQQLAPDEQITFSAFQGLVNRTQPRFILLDERAGEGRDTWLQTKGMDVRHFHLHAKDKRFGLIAKYATELRGVVLYDPSRSPHFRNLAGTVAGLEQALPVTPEILRELLSAGWDPKILVDLTELPFTTSREIYQHLIENYWERCNKRLIISARPEDHGDLHHTRDLAAACGAAVIWLDPRNSQERKDLGRFFQDMKPGHAIALGWYSTERSGITAASEYGIGTMPADFFNGATVFSGGPREIHVPPVPKMPLLENKVYVAMFISDGDNIQYVQHAMRSFWDQGANLRGKVPMNWTIAPGLVDIAPGMLNYYYETSTPMECFVSGPSGMGYLIPFNTLKEEGADVGATTTQRERMDGYTRMTGNYMERAGLRVTTIWDDATPDQRASYAENCRQLYGLTVQNFRDVPSVASSVEEKRLRFEKLGIPYAGSYDHIHGDLTRAIGRWNGKEPLFLAYQMDVWHEMKPQRILDLYHNLQKEFPDQVEFVRADHYFNLRNQAEGIAYNLCMDPETTVRSTSGDGTTATDGTSQTEWTSTVQEPWIGLDFGSPRTLRRYLVRHLPHEARAASLALQVSEDGKRWNTVDTRLEIEGPVDDVEIPPVRTRYARLRLAPTAKGRAVGIGDLEVYGTR